MCIRDRGLPDGDGIELVHEVRKQHSLPILIVSARHQEAQKIRLLDAGADDYLAKPFSVGEPVSYTHLDVYKRQALALTRPTCVGVARPDVTKSQ